MRIDPHQLQTGGVLLGCVATFVVAFWLPRQRAVADRTRQIDERSARLTQLWQTPVSDAPTGTTARRLWHEDFEAAVPGRADLGPLLEQLSESLAIEGLEVQQLQASAVVEGGDFTRIPVTVQFEGSSAALFGLLQRIESSSRIIRLDRLDVTGAEDAGDLLFVDLQLSAFFRPGEGPS